MKIDFGPTILEFGDVRGGVAVKAAVRASCIGIQAQFDGAGAYGALPGIKRS